MAVAEEKIHQIHRKLPIWVNHMQILVQNCGSEAPNIDKK